MHITAGKWKSRKLKSPKTGMIRPTRNRVKEALFSIIEARENWDWEGKQVLDLFSGSGVLGFEALSRGASYCLFVDTYVEARALIRENSDLLGAGGMCKVSRQDATDMGKCSPRMAKGFDLILLDPPYGKNLGRDALLSIVQGGWIGNGSLLVMEDDRRNNFMIPSEFEKVDCRYYGTTALFFMCYSSKP